MVRSRPPLGIIRDELERSDIASSTACGITIAYIAYTIALGYSGNAVIRPLEDEAPHNYAYRMVSTQSKPRVPGGPPILYNNAPLELYQACEGAGGNRKRDGSCPLTQLDSPTGTEALPASSSAAIMAGDGGQPEESSGGTSPSLSAALEAIVGGISAGVAAGHASPTLTTSPSTTATATFSCYHDADPQNTCPAIANGPGWCVCGGSPASYAVQTSTDLACDWTTLPPITSFDCPTMTTTLAPTKAQTTYVDPAPSTPPTPTPNAGISIWLQQYTSIDGAAVDVWWAYSFSPGDAKLGNPCSTNPCGTVPVPDGTLRSADMSIYPTDMAISAYGRKLRYTSFFDLWVGNLWDTKTGVGLAICNAVVDAKGVPCDDQLLLTPRVTCEWVN